MTKFKKGDEVEIIGHHWDDGREVEDMQYVVGSKGKIVGGLKDVYLDVDIEGQNISWGILPSDLKLIGEPTDLKINISKQTTFYVGSGELRLQHTTNSKKNKVSIQRTGTKIGTIKFDEIDTIIEILTELKSEVEAVK